MTKETLSPLLRACELCWVCVFCFVCRFMTSILVSVFASAAVCLQTFVVQVARDGHFCVGGSSHHSVNVVFLCVYYLFAFPFKARYLILIYVFGFSKMVLHNNRRAFLCVSVARLVFLRQATRFRRFCTLVAPHTESIVLHPLDFAHPWLSRCAATSTSHALIGHPPAGLLFLFCPRILHTAVWWTRRRNSRRGGCTN